MATMIGTYLSFSRLNTYHSCGEKFRLSYVEKDTPKIPQGPLMAGIALHDTIDESEKHGWWQDPDPWEQMGEATRFFNEQFAKWIAKQPYDEIRWAGRKTKEYPEGENDKWWYVQGPMMLRRYAATRRHDAEQGYVIPEGSSEMTIGTTMPNTGTHITMRLDAFLMVNADGERVIRDWKTGRPGDGMDYALQLATYAWGIKQAMGVTVETGEIGYLRQANADKRIAKVDVRPFMDLVVPMYEQLEEGVAAGFFPYRPSSFCKSCNVKESCAVGRQM